MTKFFSILILTVIYSSNSLSQSTVEKYNNETAKMELDKFQQAIQSGTEYQIRTELLEYICNNLNTFPKVTPDMSIDQKLAELLPVQKQLTMVFKQFLLNPENKKDSISYDAALLMIALGNISAQILPVANEFMSTFDKNDESYEIRIKGMQQAFYGVKNTLVGYLITTFAENRNQYVTPMLIEHLYLFGPQILRALPNDIRKDALKNIKESVEPRVTDDLKKEYKKLYKKLQKIS